VVHQAQLAHHLLYYVQHLLRLAEDKRFVALRVCARVCVRVCKNLRSSLFGLDMKEWQAGSRFLQ